MITEECCEVIWHYSSLHDLVVLAAVALGPFEHVPNRDAVHDEPLLTLVVVRAPVYPKQLLNSEPEGVAAVRVVLVKPERLATWQGAKNDHSCIVTNYRFEAFYVHAVMPRRLLYWVRPHLVARDGWFQTSGQFF